MKQSEEVWTMQGFSTDFTLWFSVGEMGLASVCKHTVAETHLIKTFTLLMQVPTCTAQTIPSKLNALNCAFLLLR